jgi:predicted esterase
VYDRAMTATLLALHGFTQNGANLRAELAELVARFDAGPRIECPDGPFVCAEASVERLQRMVGGARWPGPHLAWWDATDDGREYRGLDLACERLGEIVERALADGGRVGVLGFSQGAIATACLAALAAHGRFPRFDFAVLIAGRTPRADAIAPLFASPLPIPSLHVWGTRDALSSAAGSLAECFDAGTREIATWAGPHVVPTRGTAADAIVRFVARFC